jgi:hypothetical protein
MVGTLDIPVIARTDTFAAKLAIGIKIHFCPRGKWFLA